MWDGLSRTVVSLTNASDGTGESAVLKVDVSELAGAPTRVKIMKAHFATFGMAVILRWDATTDVTALVLQGAGSLDFTNVGGLPNNAGTGVTGDLLLTTLGHSAGDSYSIVLELSKR